MANIKNLRRELKAWGLFWSSNEYGSGFSDKSNVLKVAEFCKRGGVVFSQSSAFEMHVPQDIEVMTYSIDKLSVHERLVLIGKYVKKKKGAELADWAQLPSAKSAEFWLLIAEKALM